MDRRGRGNGSAVADAEDVRLTTSSSPSRGFRLQAEGNAYAGLFTSSSLSLIPWIVPGIVMGVPIGGFIIRQVRVETFRRICMSFDAWIVAFGLSRLLQELGLVAGSASYLVVVGVGLLDVCLLYRFFAVHLPGLVRLEAMAVTSADRRAPQSPDRR